MPKHRSTVYTVVREKRIVEHGLILTEWEFDGLVGTYLSAQRADEVTSATIQKYLDMGMSKDTPEYRCTVHASTWYEE